MPKHHLHMQIPINCIDKTHIYPRLGTLGCTIIVPIYSLVLTWQLATCAKTSVPSLSIQAKSLWLGGQVHAWASYWMYRRPFVADHAWTIWHVLYNAILGQKEQQQPSRSRSWSMRRSSSNYRLAQPYINYYTRLYNIDLGRHCIRYRPRP